MKNWSDGLRRVLDGCEHAVPVFFRDDDGGWNDPALRALVERFADHGVPLDVALIPSAVTPELADWLAERVGPKFGLHQHGFEHVNNERQGRKCEFGAARGYRKQRRDLSMGQERLKALLGRRLDPIFTPPWNRCTAETLKALQQLGFVALSRDVGARPLGVEHTLRELPVTLDWMKHRGPDGRPDLAALGDRLGQQLLGDRPVGIMLHHAVMNDDDLRAVQALLAVLRSHLVVDCRPMRDLVGLGRPSQRPEPTRIPGHLPATGPLSRLSIPRSLAELRG